MILKVTGDSLQKVESEFTKIIDSNVGRGEKLKQLFSLMAEGHVETQSIMKEGFVGLAIQNAELIAELKEQNKALKDQLNQLQEQLKFVTEELQERKEREWLLQERRSDFEFMQLFKDGDCYIFTAENSKKALTREAFTNLTNKFMKDCARKMDQNPNLSSHSFRIGFITQLWRDTNNMEFVRQAIGHAKIDTTSQYVDNLSEKEWQAMDCQRSYS